MQSPLQPSQRKLERRRSARHAAIGSAPCRRKSGAAWALSRAMASVTSLAEPRHISRSVPDVRSRNRKTQRFRSPASIDRYSPPPSPWRPPGARCHQSANLKCIQLVQPPPHLLPLIQWPQLGPQQNSWTEAVGEGQPWADRTVILRISWNLCASVNSREDRLYGAPLRHYPIGHHQRTATITRSRLCRPWRDRHRN